MPERGETVPRLRGQLLLVGVVLLTALPPLVGVLARPHYDADDNALIEIGVRQVLAGRPPDVGVYSRFGWYHPGPALYYLLAPLYLLFGRTGTALQLAALTLNTVCLVGIALLLRYLRGTAVALGGLAVCLLHLHLLPPTFASDYWNAALPLLPFLLACLLCWAAVAGLSWGLPAALVLLTICVQMHVGYLVAAGAVVLVSVVALTVARRSGTPSASDDARARLTRIRPWLVAAVAGVLLWAPPLLQQLRSGPGNLGTLAADLTRAAPHPPLADAWAMVRTDLGRLPAFLSGTRTQPRFVIPPVLPAWTGWLGVVAAAAAAGLALRRRGGRRDAVGLTGVVLAGMLLLAAVVAFTRIRGLIFTYLVQWSTAAAVLTWTAVLAVFAGRSHLLARRRLQAVALATVGAVVPLTATDIPDRGPGRPDVRDAARQATSWATAGGARTVDLELLPMQQPRWIGLLEPGTGAMLELDRAGIAVQPPDELAFSAANVLPPAPGPAQAVLFVGEAGNVAAVPPGATLIAQDGQVVVYGQLLGGRRPATACAPGPT